MILAKVAIVIGFLFLSYIAGYFVGRADMLEYLKEGLEKRKDGEVH